MENQPISFTGTLTLQDALDLHHYRGLCVLRLAFRWLIGIVAFVLAAICVTVIVFGKGNVLLWIILGLCTYFLVGWRYERRWAVRRQYRLHPEYFIESTVTVDEANVSVSNANMNLRLAWNQVAFLLVTPRGLLFMLPQMRPLCWLPIRLFEGNNCEEEVVAYAEKNQVAVKILR